MSKKTKNTDDRTLDNIAVGLGNQEVVARYGSANAEYIKAYSGVDNETGQVFTKSLKGISKGKLNSEYYDKNIRQQAGYSAEVMKVADDNSENIIKGSSRRTERTDDNVNRRKYNNNKPDMVSDHVETINGIEISNSSSQMKIVSNYKNLIKKIAQGEGGGKNDLSRYMENKYIDISGEHYANALEYCKERSKSLFEQAANARKRGDIELATKLEGQAKNYNDLGEKLRQSYTTEEAVNFRLHPMLETGKRMVSVSHRAGIEAAKYGAVIGGAVSILKNAVAFGQGNKAFGEALYDTTCDTGKSALVAYGTGFTGSAVKSFMQQSSKQALRQLSKTSLPSLIVSSVIAFGSSIARYTKGEINEIQLMEDLGEKGTGMLASGMMAAFGQIAIPIPVVGAVIGGMIGYMLSSMFYSQALTAFKEAEEAESRYHSIKAKCEEARHWMSIYQNDIQKSFDLYIENMNEKLLLCFNEMDDALECGNINIFANAANRLGYCIGKGLQFSNMDEFENFMAEDYPLRL